MSATEQGQATERETEKAPPLVHIYPGRPEYRLSGNDRPQVGDIAWCGRRKSRPFSGRFTVGDATCVVCAAMEGRP